MPVTENVVQEPKAGFNKEIEAIRPFHSGPLKRCSRCGRMVFHPCLVCETERKGNIADPFDTGEADGDDLHVELLGEERKRYEYARLEKLAESVRREDSETASVFSFDP